MGTTGARNKKTPMRQARPSLNFDNFGGAGLSSEALAKEERQTKFWSGFRIKKPEQVGHGEMVIWLNGYMVLLRSDSVDIL